MCQRREPELWFTTSSCCYSFESCFHGWRFFSLHRRPNPPFVWSPCFPRTIQLPLAASPCSRLSRPQSVGSEEARCRAGLRPPPKLHVQFSRMQLSRRLKSSEMPRFLAPVGLIRSASLLGRERNGFFAKGTVPTSLVLAHLVSFFLPDHLRRLPSPTHFCRRLPGHMAFTTLHRYYSAVRLLTEPRSPLRFAYRSAYSGATRSLCQFS